MEAIGRDLREMQRVPLAPSHVTALRKAGAEVQYEAGDFLCRQGQPIDRFTYVVEGEIEVVNAFTGERLVPSTLGATQFMAEIPLLSGGNWQMPMRAVVTTRVIEVPRTEMLRLMSEIPEMSDIVITVLAARRRRHVESRESALVLIGEDVASFGCWGVVLKDRPIIAIDRVRYVGDPVAVVIAETIEIAENAAELVDVEYEELPRATTIREAVAEDAPLIHERHENLEDFYFKGGARPTPNSNVFHTYRNNVGDVDAAEAAAAYVHEDRFTFPAISHFAMEPHTVIADFRGDYLTVWAGAQTPTAVQKVLSRLFGLQLAKIRIIVDGKRNENAAWYYPEPYDAAKGIKDYVAFWEGVEVSGTNEDTVEIRPPTRAAG